MAAIIRFLLKLQKIWDDFVAAWNKTIGPLVDAASEILDDLTGGLISQFQVALERTADRDQDDRRGGAHDVRRHLGLDEHGRAQGLVGGLVPVERHDALPAHIGDLPGARPAGRGAARRHATAVAIDSSSSSRSPSGYITHIGTDTIAHSFVNEQCGGPYRDHPTRHHLIENHIDAWNYSQSGAGGTIPTDPWGKTDDYPDLSMSALWFLVQQTPDDPHGAQRPSPLSDDPDERKEQLDVDGEMPGWMAEAIVKAMIETFEDHPHPQDLPGRRVPAADRPGPAHVGRQGCHRPRSRPAVPGAPRRHRPAATVLRCRRGSRCRGRCRPRTG